MDACLRGRVGKANLDTEEELLRQILGAVPEKEPGKQGTEVTSALVVPDFGLVGWEINAK